MIAAWVVAIATLATGPEIAVAQFHISLAAMQRLAASAPRVKPGATTQEKAELPPRRAELEVLMIYLGMTKWDESDLRYMLKLIRQTVATAKGFDLLPEEVLCWERAAVNLTAAVERVTAQRVNSGEFSPQALILAKAAVERFRKSYKTALSRCVEKID